jgi:hemerythrin-like metal-binding protein
MVLPLQRAIMMDVIYEIPASLSIDFDSINAEHEKLVSVLNDALRLIRTEQGSAAGIIDESLTDLSAAMQAHFNHEEGEMAGLGYGDLPQHKVSHARCLARLNAIRQSVGNRGVNKNVLDQVFDMILDDIIRADSGFKSFLYARGILRV